MDAHADPDLLLPGPPRVLLPEGRLDGDAALHGVHRGVEEGDEGVPDGVVLLALELREEPPDHLAVALDEPDRALLVFPHHAGEALDVGEHHRGQSALVRGRRGGAPAVDDLEGFAAVFVHGPRSYHSGPGFTSGSRPPGT